MKIQGPGAQRSFLGRLAPIFIKKTAAFAKKITRALAIQPKKGCAERAPGGQKIFTKHSKDFEQKCNDSKTMPCISACVDMTMHSLRRVLQKKSQQKNAKQSLKGRFFGH